MRLGALLPAARLPALCIFCSALLSCVTNGQVEGGGYWGTRGAVQGAAAELKALNDAGKLPSFDAEAMNGTVHDLAESAVVGAGDGAKQLELDKDLKKLIEVLFETTEARSNALLKSVIEQQGPRVEALTRSLLSGTLGEARSELKETTQKDLPAATRLVITDAVDSFATAMGSEKVGTVRKDLVATTGEVTYAASANAVIGLRTELANQKTLDALEGVTATVTDTVLKKVKDSAKDTVDKWLLTVVGLLLVAVGIILFQLWRARATIRALKLVTAEINKHEHAKSLKESIQRKAAQHTALDRYLKDFLLDNRL